MTTRTLVRVGAIPLACLILLTIGSRSGHPQPPGDPVRPAIVVHDAPPPIVEVPPIAPPPRKPATMNVETLIAQLHDLRKQKADLDRQEKAVVEQLQERLKHQSDELTKLGVIPPVARFVIPSPNEVNLPDVPPAVKK